ncbi:unnamed protein product [Schistosoma margrebowiei]|uniref:Uncharacterized protein n=1 Tax=Schistosoma margrebowiei TaxID=48269 RepID=A0A183MBB6_9TREM|nr:unnamed protein product [Schistosoma margrebowiei]
MFAFININNLNIHKGENKILKYNTMSTVQVTLDGDALEEMESFTRLGSTIDKQGIFDDGVKAKINKARAASLQMNSICNSKQLSVTTKVRIFNTNNKKVLLYGA